MKRIYFITLFLILLIGSAIVAFTSNQSVSEASGNLNKDKIKTIAQDITKQASEKTKEIASLVAEKAKEVAVSAYEEIKEKGGEAVSATIVEPSMAIVKTVVKEILSSASSSILTDKDVEEILLTNGSNSCSCK